MRKINHQERTLIDTLTFLTVFTLIFGFSNLTVHGFAGVGARFTWYLVICLCAVLYISLYYDSTVLKKCFPKAENFDPYLTAIPLLPLLLYVVIPSDFPITEYKVWFGAYVLIAFLLCIRHASVYTYPATKQLAKYLFVASSILLALLNIMLFPSYLEVALPIALAYLLVPMSCMVILLHIMRIERRSASFLKKEFTLLVVFMVIVALSYFGGIFTIVEMAFQKILNALMHIVKLLAQLIPQEDPQVFEPMTYPTRFEHSTETTTNTFTFPPYTGTMPTTTEFVEIPPKPFNYWFIVVPLLIALIWVIYEYTRKHMKKADSGLFVEERERAQDEPARKPSGRKLFQRKTPRERVRSAYARFMRRLEKPTDTTRNLETFSRDHKHEPSKVTSAEQLTDTYRKARYIDVYEVTESDAKYSESDIKTIERKKE